MFIYKYLNIYFSFALNKIFYSGYGTLTNIPKMSTTLILLWVNSHHLFQTFCIPLRVDKNIKGF